MNNELIDYYSNLLILQYRSKTKAVDHIKNIVETQVIYDLMRDVENGYDIDSAVGKQLDVIAKYVGASRVITVQEDITGVRWGFVDYLEATPYVDVVGVVDYSQDPLPDADMITYESGVNSNYVLTDDELRFIIKLKIIENNSNYSPESIDNLLFDAFGDKIQMNDNLNMTIEYIIDKSVSPLLEISITLLPKPMAVKLLITIVEDINNIFGFLNYSAVDVPVFLQGIIDYSASPFGGWLTY